MPPAERGTDGVGRRVGRPGRQDEEEDPERSVRELADEGDVSEEPRDVDGAEEGGSRVGEGPL